MKRQLLRLAAWTVALLALHALLGRVLAGRDFMAALAAARHGHFGVALLALVFLAVRITTFVFWPAAVVSRVGVALYDRWRSPAE
jgi:hypothetical protein